MLQIQTSLALCCLVPFHSKLQMWYEKHQMWELTKHHKPTRGEQPSQPGKFTDDYLQPALGHLAYPLQRSLLPEQYVLKPGHTGRSYSMKCLSFTNTEGKTNPGDRVDMDVSTLIVSASVSDCACSRA